ncbi:hypothetical protein BaRGS_00016758, partial [Batillaria attramentaria]
MHVKGCNSIKGDNSAAVAPAITVILAPFSGDLLTGMLVDSLHARGVTAPDTGSDGAPSNVPLCPLGGAVYLATYLHVQFQSASPAGNKTQQILDFRDRKGLTISRDLKKKPNVTEQSVITREAMIPCPTALTRHCRSDSHSPGTLLFGRLVPLVRAQPRPTRTERLRVGEADLDYEVSPSIACFFGGTLICHQVLVQSKQLGQPLMLGLTNGPSVTRTRTCCRLSELLSELAAAATVHLSFPLQPAACLVT